MQTTDLEIHERWRERVTADGSALPGLLSEAHNQNLPHLRIQLAIWLNAKQDPWSDGVTLLEICGNSPVEPQPTFRPIEFGPHGGWPRLRLIESSVKEFQLDESFARKEGRAPYWEQVAKAIDAGTAAVVFPKSASKREFLDVVARQGT